MTIYYENFYYTKKILKINYDKYMMSKNYAFNNKI